MLNRGEGVLGLAWGTAPEAAEARFGGLEPVARTAEALGWELEDVAARLKAEDAFCPTPFQPEICRAGDRLELRFAGGALVGAEVAFSYGFDRLGQDADALSDQAMSVLARAEMQRLIVELAARYGPPASVIESTSRRGKLHGIGAALFTAEDGGPVHLYFGHDGDGLAGEINWLAPARGGGGF